MSREAIEEAIEVLDDASAEMLTETGDENYYVEAIAVLRQALEVYGGNCYGDGTVYRGQRSKDSSVTTYTTVSAKWIPVHTAPPKKEWVGLTDQEINSVRYKRDWTAFWTDTTFARSIEAKLKEKNT